MGVKGLWTLVEPTGKPIRLEALTNKILAIDASIWLHQFLKALRDKEGNSLKNSHILGFFRRICKLLFWNVKPVFVFDGGVPEMKRLTVIERRRRKEGSSNSAARTAEKLLAAQLKLQVLKNAKLSENQIEDGAEGNTNETERAGPKTSNSTTNKRLTPDDSSFDSRDVVYMDELELPKEIVSKRRKKDQYELPPMNINFSGPANDKEDARLPFLEEEMKLWEDDEEFKAQLLDFNSPIFATLPLSVQHEIVLSLTQKSRQFSHKRLSRMLNSSKSAYDFSKAQIQLLMNRNHLMSTLNNISGVDEGAQRIAADRNKRFMLVKNGDAGWKMVKEGGESQDDSQKDATSREVVDVESSSSGDDEDYVLEKEKAKHQLVEETPSKSEQPNNAEIVSFPLVGAERFTEAGAAAFSRTNLVQQPRTSPLKLDNKTDTPSTQQIGHNVCSSESSKSDSDGFEMIIDGNDNEKNEDIALEEAIRLSLLESSAKSEFSGNQMQLERTSCAGSHSELTILEGEALASESSESPHSDVTQDMANYVADDEPIEVIMQRIQQLEGNQSQSASTSSSVSPYFRTAKTSSTPSKLVTDSQRPSSSSYKNYIQIPSSSSSPSTPKSRSSQRSSGQPQLTSFFKQPSHQVSSTYTAYYNTQIPTRPSSFAKYFSSSLLFDALHVWDINECKSTLIGLSGKISKLREALKDSTSDKGKVIEELESTVWWEEYLEGVISIREDVESTILSPLKKQKVLKIDLKGKGKAVESKSIGGSSKSALFAGWTDDDEDMLDSLDFEGDLSVASIRAESSDQDHDKEDLLDKKNQVQDTRLPEVIDLLSDSDEEAVFEEVITERLPNLDVKSDATEKLQLRQSQVVLSSGDESDEFVQVEVPTRSELKQIESDNFRSSDNFKPVIEETVEREDIASEFEPATDAAMDPMNSNFEMEKDEVSVESNQDLKLGTTTDPGSPMSGSDAEFLITDQNYSTSILDSADTKIAIKSGEKEYVEAEIINLMNDSDSEVIPVFTAPVNEAPTAQALSVNLPSESRNFDTVAVLDANIEQLPAQVYTVLDDEEEDTNEAMENESREFVKFISSIQQRDVSSVSQELEKEVDSLNERRRKEKRDAEDVTQDMVRDSQELLRLFGIPYVISPMEAEAQCAHLTLNSLVDGVVTDDSDVFLFGGTLVYKNFFNNSKYVESYNLVDIYSTMKMDREKLIAIAYLCGSDYTPGVSGVGVVTAMEILSEFFDGNAYESMRKFASWWRSIKVGEKAPEGENAIKKKLRKAKSRYEMPSGFPDPRVRESYMRPMVDESDTRFQWGIPDIEGLRSFLGERLGWDSEKVDGVVVPVLKEMNNRKNFGVQTTLPSFFSVDSQSALDKKLSQASKRIQNVINTWNNPNSSQLATEVSGTPQRKATTRKRGTGRKRDTGLSLNNRGKTARGRGTRGRGRGRGRGNGSSAASKKDDAEDETKLTISNDDDTSMSEDESK